jgi:hypothetical protein
MRQLEITLESFVCDTCHERVPEGYHRALVIATWRRRADRLCVACWRQIMEAAEQGMRAQRPELFPVGD